MKKSWVTKAAKAVGGGWRFLVVIVFSWCWLVSWSQIAWGQSYCNNTPPVASATEGLYLWSCLFQAFPDENSSDPQGYAQVQVEHAVGGYIFYESVGPVYEEAYGSTSLASNIDTYDIDEYAWWSDSGSTPKLFCNLDNQIYYDNDYVNSYLLTLKATTQPGYVFDHWEVENSSMDLSQFTNIATPEATIELCDSNNQNKSDFDLHASYRAVFRPLAAPPTPTPVPTVTPPGHDNGDGGGNTTTPSAPQCQAAKPDDPAPYLTHATSGGAGSITLHYQLGGKPYTKYLVEYGYTDADFTFGTTITNPEVGSVTINDLNLGTTYQFRLIPTNDCAAGTPSNTFPVAVGGLPKVPGVPNTGY